MPMVTIIAALIAASVATFGYWVTARAKLLEDRRKTYAAALAAVHAYQELPFQIRRRPDSSAATRDALGTAISNAQRDLDFHGHLLELDSAKLGRRYFALVQAARRQGKPYRDQAWKMEPAASDEAMGFAEEYPYDVNDEMAKCLAEMHHHLRLVGLKSLRSSSIDATASSSATRDRPPVPE